MSEPDSAPIPVSNHPPNFPVGHVSDVSDCEKAATNRSDTRELQPAADTMKVVFYSHALGRGGAERWLVDLATGLSREKFDVTIVLDNGYRDRALLRQASAVRVVALAKWNESEFVDAMVCWSAIPPKGQSKTDRVLPAWKRTLCQAGRQKRGSCPWRTPDGCVGCGSRAFRSLWSDHHHLQRMRSRPFGAASRARRHQREAWNRTAHPGGRLPRATGGGQAASSGRAGRGTVTAARHRRPSDVRRRLPRPEQTTGEASEIHRQPGDLHRAPGGDRRLRGCYGCDDAPERDRRGLRSPRSRRGSPACRSWPRRSAPCRSLSASTGRSSCASTWTPMTTPWPMPSSSPSHRRTRPSWHTPRNSHGESSRSMKWLHAGKGTYSHYDYLTHLHICHRHAAQNGVHHIARVAHCAAPSAITTIRRRRRERNSTTRLTASTPTTPWRSPGEIRAIAR